MQTETNNYVISILRIGLTIEEFKKLRQGEEVLIFFKKNGLNISVCISVHKEDFPETKDSRLKPVNNVGERKYLDGIYHIRISLSEVTDPITQRIIGEFKKAEPYYSEYDSFEIDLQI